VNRVVSLEPWLTKRQLADQLGCGVRFIEYRQAEGMPHALIAGRVKFRQSEAEAWLEEHGHLVRHGEAA
jgi:hypothetical protein